MGLYMNVCSNLFRGGAPLPEPCSSLAQDAWLSALQFAHDSLRLLRGHPCIPVHIAGSFAYTSLYMLLGNGKKNVCIYYMCWYVS